MTILYRVHHGLYVNLTNRCSCACTFCVRGLSDSVGEAESLWLSREPTYEEVIAAFDGFDMSQFNEVVFCGFGEPTEAWDTLMHVARYVKDVCCSTRVNTNGLGSLICGRDIAPEFEGIIDTVSISLNAPDAKTYQKIVRSSFGEKSFDAVIDFARGQAIRAQRGHDHRRDHHLARGREEVPRHLREARRAQPYPCLGRIARFESAPKTHIAHTSRLARKSSSRPIPKALTPPALAPRSPTTLQPHPYASTHHRTTGGLPSVASNTSLEKRLVT